MAKKQKPTPAPADDGLKNVSDYRFPGPTRKNNPPAKIAAEGYVPLVPKAEYLYSPRRPPELRFDPTGRSDELPELLAKATKQKLTEAEAWALAEALRVHEPWLEWAGKRETKSFARGPGRAAYPRAGKRAGHPESGGARGCEPVAVRGPGAGGQRGRPILQARSGLVESFDPGRQPPGHVISGPARRCCG